ncbi:MAG TPA: anthranilate phosphoribosyltransferase, partial [Candidatus Omnitrophica bacterium]|nr:anthranilate phosphoribosyltransferase [Candidatus Omnitrophota bacterium]
LIEGILEGKNKESKDVVLANASCCFYLLGRVKSLKEGVKLADFLIKEGKAKDKLVEFREFIQKYA